MQLLGLKNVNYKFISNTEILIIKNKNIIKIGMSEEEVKVAINEIISAETFAEFIFPDKKSIEKKIYIGEKISFNFIDDALVLIEVFKDNDFYYENIDITKKKYEKTVKELQDKGFDYIKSDDGYKFEELNIFITIDDNKLLQSSCIYEKSYYKNIEERIKKYNILYKIENGKSVFYYSEK
jgi:hypothetical protein